MSVVAYRINVPCEKTALVPFQHRKQLRQLVHIQRGDEFPERLFTLLELAVVQRQRSFFGRSRGVRRERTGKERAVDAE